MKLTKKDKIITGIVTVVSFAVSIFLSGSDSFFSDRLNAIYYFAPVFPPLVALFLLNQKRLETASMTTTNKVANILTWLILFGVVALAIVILYFSI